MNQVAQHINEVQKVTELYAHLFDYLLLQSQLAEVCGCEIKNKV